MKKPYHILGSAKQQRVSPDELTRLLSQNGQLMLPPSLHRCLATTNIVESPNAGVRRRTRRVTRWKDASMVRRWAAAAFLDTEKSFRKIMGYKDLWMLNAVLNPTDATKPKAA